MFCKQCGKRLDDGAKKLFIPTGGEGEPDNNNNRDGGQNYGVICSGYRSGSGYYIEPGQWNDIANNSEYSSGYFICEWE